MNLMALGYVHGQMMLLMLASLCLFVYTFRGTLGLRYTSYVYKTGRFFLPFVILAVMLRFFYFDIVCVTNKDMLPNVGRGDLVAMDRQAYGYRIPVINRRLFEQTQDSTPKRGDMIFYKCNFNKYGVCARRVVGLPGDKVGYTSNKKILLNGSKIGQAVETQVLDRMELFSSFTTTKLEAIPSGVGNEKYIYRVQNFLGFSSPVKERVVPEGMYYVLGDNRDEVSDSRDGEFVADHDVLGKAERVICRFNFSKHVIPSIINPLAWLYADYDRFWDTPELNLPIYRNILKTLAADEMLSNLQSQAYDEDGNKIGRFKGDVNSDTGEVVISFKPNEEFLQQEGTKKVRIQLTK